MPARSGSLTTFAHHSLRLPARSRFIRFAAVAQHSPCPSPNPTHSLHYVHSCVGPGAPHWVINEVIDEVGAPRPSATFASLILLPYTWGRGHHTRYIPYAHFTHCGAPARSGTSASAWECATHFAYRSDPSGQHSLHSLCSLCNWTRYVRKLFTSINLFPNPFIPLPFGLLAHREEPTDGARMTHSLSLPSSISLTSFRDKGIRWR